MLEAHRIRWEVGFNDPSIMGWLMVAAYAAAGFLAWRAGTAAARRGQAFERGFWHLLAGAMALLALNKQLDLQVLLTDVGRYWAVRHDLYQQRRALQGAFMLAGVVGLGIALAGSWLATRGRDPVLRVALGGLTVCGGYILIRAASFHHTDALLRTTIAGTRWNGIVELVGAVLVGAAAWRYREAAKPRR